jgi:Zn-dependent protease
MKWSWKVAEFRGIGVYVHATFLILIAFVVASHWMAGHSLGKTLEGVLFVLALFVCVVLHEFGHALMAARFGIRTRDITLLPIGGLARLERMPHDPLQELWVALAGPAVNVVIAALLLAGLSAAASWPRLDELGVARGGFFHRLMVVNVILVVFNLIPAFPMDGGRVLRAILALRMEYTRATRIAASIGQALALLFGLMGFLVGNPFLMFIALFVWIGAAQEASMVETTASFAGVPVARAMITQFETLAPEDRLADAVEKILAGSQQDFPVVADGRVVGILTRQDLLVALARHGPQVPVAEVMQSRFETAEATEMLDTAFRRLQGCECHTLPVLHRGALVGLLTMDNLGEFVAIREALEAAAGHAPPRTVPVA